jgi:chorismate mutase
MGIPIDDPEREQQVIECVRSSGVVNHIDPDYVEVAFHNLINANNAIQHARWADWKLKRCAAPSWAPDLSLSRATIDRLNQIIVREIAAQWYSLHIASNPLELGAARTAVIIFRQLDNLYQQALAYATHSYYG